MSGAAGALLCCCADPVLCGGCPQVYRFSWNGSLQALALCCPVLYCPDADESQGQSQNLCDPCTYIVDEGGNPCEGDCPGDGCQLIVYDGSVGPIEMELRAAASAPPCIYLGQTTVEMPVAYCCPVDPKRPQCGHGDWGVLRFIINVQLSRGGFGLPTSAWRLTLLIQYQFDPINCPKSSGTIDAVWIAYDSEDLCPHQAVFQLVGQSGFEASQLDPCNIASGFCPVLNIHSADAGTIELIP